MLSKNVCQKFVVLDGAAVVSIDGIKSGSSLTFAQLHSGTTKRSGKGLAWARADIKWTRQGMGRAYVREIVMAERWACYLP